MLPEIAPRRIPTTSRAAPWVLGEQAEGISPLASPRTVREPLDSHRSRQANTCPVPGCQCTNRRSCLLAMRSRKGTARVLWPLSLRSFFIGQATNVMLKRHIEMTEDRIQSGRVMLPMVRDPALKEGPERRDCANERFPQGLEPCDSGSSAAPPFAA